MIDAMMRDVEIVQYMLQAVVIIGFMFGCVLLILAALWISSTRTDDQNRRPSSGAVNRSTR